MLCYTDPRKREVYTMTGMVLRPPERHTRPLRQEPLIFLAGPIQGAPDWQATAIGWLQKHHPLLHIASPRSLMWETSLFPEERERLFDIQQEWEHDYIDYALDRGVVLFWLAKEAVHHCDRAYAQTSRFELGFALGNALVRQRAGFKRLAPVRVAVGADKDFSNRNYLTKTMSKRFGLPMHATLEDTLEAAVDIVDACMN